MGLENADVAMCQTMHDRGFNNSENTSVTYLGDKGVRQESRRGRCDK